MVISALLTGRRVSVSDVDQALLVEGLRLLDAQLRAECLAAAERGERSPMYETLLAIINGDDESRGLIRRVSKYESRMILDPLWEPITPE